MGAAFRVLSRCFLPYDVVYEGVVTRSDPPHRLEIDTATSGAGRTRRHGVIRITLTQRGDRVEVVDAEELGRHGYELSPGTIYPVLHGMEAAGYLARENRLVGGKVRKYYTITPAGRAALDEARQKIHELVAEVLEGRGPPSLSTHTLTRETRGRGLRSAS